MKHPIPRAALDDRLGFIGTSGSGKTYNAGTAIEILLAQKARAVIIDPLGVWWGLRLLADGKKPSGFNVVIFGGDHADLPLNEQAGALLGETAATMSESCIIDLSKLTSRSAERRFMVAFLETIYRKAGGEPFHLIVDEADLFAPQRPHAGDEVLLGHMENIVRRGRVRGFIPWLISQRPAVLNKNVLSQVDGLLAFKLTSVQDRDALDAWIEGQADKAQGKAIKDALPTFPIGEGVVWLPGHGILARRPFPTKVTFDSSRKPKRGEKLKDRKLQPLDVGKLKDQLAAVVEESKANDPKALRAEVTKLRAELEKKPNTVLKADERAIENARVAGFQAGYAECLSSISSTMEFLDNASESIQSAGIAIESFEKQLKLLHKAKHTPPKTSASPAVPANTVLTPMRSVPPPSPKASGDGDIPTPLRKIIDAILWWNVMGVAQPSQVQVGFVAGYSHKSGTWSTYLGRARALNLIEGRGELVLTADGSAAAQAPGTPPSGEILRATVLAKIDGPLQRIMRPILDAYPNALTQEEAGQAAGYSHQSGTWSTYLGRARSLDLIEGRGELKAQGWLFP